MTLRTILNLRFLRLAFGSLALATVLAIFPTAHAEDVRGGSFSGLNGHATTGSVTIEKSGDGYQIVLGENFSFDGAPDPKVALGKDGEYDPATLIELLRSNTGSQTYDVPAGIDISAYNEVYIWCEKYTVGLGVAKVN